MVRVSCFLSSLENLSATERLVASEYPRAAANYVQTQRAPSRAMAACEGVARLRSAPDAPLRFVNSEAWAKTPGESEVALVGAPRVVLTGTQPSFGYQEADSRLAFERLRKVLEQAGTSARQAAWVSYYPLSGGITNQVRKIHPDFFNGAAPPAVALIVFEGLPSMDAGFAADVLAVKE